MLSGSQAECLACNHKIKWGVNYVINRIRLTLAGHYQLTYPPTRTTTAHKCMFTHVANDRQLSPDCVDVVDDGVNGEDFLVFCLIIWLNGRRLVVTKWYKSLKQQKSQYTHLWQLQWKWGWEGAQSQSVWCVNWNRLSSPLAAAKIVYKSPASQWKFMQCSVFTFRSNNQLTTS